MALSPAREIALTKPSAMMADVNRIGFTRLSGSNGARDSPYQVKYVAAGLVVEMRLTKCSIIFVHGLRGHPRKTWEDIRESGSDASTAASSKRKTFKSFFKSRSRTPTAATVSGEEQSARLFWPEEFLTEDIPEARVWTYGYNADAIGGMFQANNKNSISHHGRDLAARVGREIDNEARLNLATQERGSG